MRRHELGQTGFDDTASKKELMWAIPRQPGLVTGMMPPGIQIPTPAEVDAVCGVMAPFIGAAVPEGEGKAKARAGETEDSRLQDTNRGCRQHRKRKRKHVNQAGRALIPA